MTAPGDLTPHPLNSPLAWPDWVYDLQDWLLGQPKISAPVYVVGGAVRDAYLRRPLHDLDLVTAGSGMKLARQIANGLGGNYFPLDQERDVGRALVETPAGRVTVDVARLRGADLAADLFDRDFTINALAVDLRGDLDAVIDATGGADDLRNKLLRRCSPASLVTDPIRALRGARQSVQLGCRIDPATLNDMRGAAAHTASVSPERIRDELFKTLTLPKPTAALRVLAAANLIGVVLPELADASHWPAALTTCERMVELWQAISPYRTDETAAHFTLGVLVMQLDQFRPQLQAHTSAVYGGGERSHRSLLALAALLHGLPLARVEAVAERLRLSNDERERLLLLSRESTRFDQTTTDRLSLYQFWRATGSGGVDAILLALAVRLRDRVALLQDEWLVLVERARVLLEAYYQRRAEIVDPPVLLNGRELMRALGLPPGPLVGDLLEQIRQGQAAGTITTAEEALAFARQQIDGRTP